MSFIAEKGATRLEDLAHTGLRRLQEQLVRAGPNPEERALGPALTHGWTPRGCISTNEGHIQEGRKDQNVSRLTRGKRRFGWLGETCQSREQAR